MGLLKHILLGDFGQSLDISETAERVELQEKAQQLQSSRLRSKDLEIARLKTHTEKLHLAISGLTKYLITRGIVAENDLAAYLDEIDATDGTHDGKLPFSNSPAKPRLIIPE